MKGVILLAVVCLAAGCATFTHQVAESDAHGVLEFAAFDPGDDEFRRVYEIDGVRVRGPVWQGVSFRVAPGAHRVVFRETQTGERPGQPAVEVRDSVFVRASVLYAGDDDPLGKTRHESYYVRSNTFVTNTVTVRSGDVLVLDGSSVSRRSRR